MLISKLNEINKNFELRMEDYPKDSFYQTIGVLAKEFELRATTLCLNDAAPEADWELIEEAVEDVFSFYSFEKNSYSEETWREMIVSLLNDAYSLILSGALERCQNKITVTSMPSKN